MPHTPGPWTARKEGGTWYVEVGHDQDYFDICELFGGGDKMEANARLIAAAPELLEALKKAIQGYSNLVELDLLSGEQKTYTAEELIPELRQALAKAEGT